MFRLRALHAAAVSLTMASVPLWAATTPTATPLGTVIAADHAHVGDAGADVGTTVYGGDRLSTETQGTVQVRAGAARLLLSSSSAAVVNDSDGAPSAKLVQGTATFSTGNAQAFTLYASKAVVRPQTDAPTIGQVTYVNDKELMVTARRGSIVVNVENDTQIVEEGKSYRVVLDPDAEAQGPAGAGGGQGPHGSGGGPLKAGRSHFLIIAVAATAAGTGVGIYKALESPDRP
ncbi:MAG TPA: hypothetical protein VMH31_12880 [Methylomirabilota bacterium]|nr:hypothetical protein [Methylomirabilota bacterium]